MQKDSTDLKSSQSMRKSSNSIGTLLIANRGPIVSRIARTCKKMGIRSLGLMTEADRTWNYIHDVDEIVELPSGPLAGNYLDIEKILAIAKAHNVDAIHPGYGFLSENSEFATKVAALGIVFVGPSGRVIETLGNKKLAKDLAKKLKIPAVESFAVGDSKEVKEHGLKPPLLIKAQAGGGGRGMRIVDDIKKLTETLQFASQEAQSSFGDGRLLVERFFPHTKHIEVQVAFDSHGQGVAFVERECTAQRRFQKYIEESPSPRLSEEMRAQLMDWAHQICVGAGYSNIGTVEFLWDYAKPSEANHKDCFYFLEVNPRLQVEHAVTEAVYAEENLDLVELQLRLAMGEALSSCVPATAGKKQLFPKTKNHALEVRICAEDALLDLRPQVGFFRYLDYDSKLARWEMGCKSDSEISGSFDSMIGKVIVSAPSRAEAVAKLQSALASHISFGPTLNLEFCRFVLSHDDFSSGDYLIESTAKSWLPQYGPHLSNTLADIREAVLKLAYLHSVCRYQTSQFGFLGFDYRPFRSLRRVHVKLEPWASEKTLTTEVAVAHTEFAEVCAKPLAKRCWEIQVHTAGRDWRTCSWADAADDKMELSLPGLPILLAQINPTQNVAGSQRQAVISYAGKVLRILKKPGDFVAANEPILVLESMKMEYQVCAPEPGYLESLHCELGEIWSKKSLPYVLRPLN